ncbi:MAG: rhodanese-like domain-containing protein, partial [Bacteroidales bacterium]|nr:rhodanese-like domain-containing protein [Bacteroidales bacterium]
KIHIPESKNIPFGDIDEQIEQLPTNKKTVFVCNQGTKSKQTVEYLSDCYPFHAIYYLEDGITGWVKMNEQNKTNIE